MLDTIAVNRPPSWDGAKKEKTVNKASQKNRSISLPSLSRTKRPFTGYGYHRFITYLPTYNLPKKEKTVDKASQGKSFSLLTLTFLTCYPQTKRPFTGYGYLPTYNLPKKEKAVNKASQGKSFSLLTRYPQPRGLLQAMAITDL